MFLCIYFENISTGIMLSVMYSANFVKLEPYMLALQYAEVFNLKRI